MSRQQDMHYKDTSPSDTVERLKAILASLGIEVVEDWMDESSINTWSLRVTIKGTTLGTNGKGTSREFALASAYAEFFERYQNDMLGMAYHLEKKSQFAFTAFHDEVNMTATELVSQENNAYFDSYFKIRNMQTDSVDAKATAFARVQKVDYYIRGDSQTYVSIPFYSLKNKKTVYIPKNVYRSSYGSNGMSAGNSFEEAVVQAISEIIERHVQQRAFAEKPTFPDIPDEYIARFPYVYQRYITIRDNKKYTCMMKDCSMGGKYPVAALIIIDNTTGKYGVKLGCHPDFGVAMERTLTEATQGQDIFDYIDRSQIDFYNHGVDDDMNIYNTYKIGRGQFPYQMFGCEDTYSFTPVKDVSAMSNREIMKYLCDSILAEGYDILIRDVSYLGFPSVNVIIPELSEAFRADDRRVRAYNTRSFTTALLRNPKMINKSNCKYLIATLEYFLPSVLENSLEGYYLWYEKGEELPCSKSLWGCIYLIAMAHILCGEYGKAANRIKVLISGKCEKYINSTNISLYQAMYYYCTAMDVLANRDSAMAYMRKIFNRDLCDAVYNLLGEENEVISKQYPSIDDYSKSTEHPFEKAEIYFNVREKLKAAQVANPINQNDLRRYF